MGGRGGLQKPKQLLPAAVFFAAFPAVMPVLLRPLFNRMLGRSFTQSAAPVLRRRSAPARSDPPSTADMASGGGLLGR